MLQSMTGFGKSTGTYNGKKFVVEIKTLNSKSLDLYLKVPNFFKEKEIELRKIIGNEVDRGKVEAIISIEYTGENNNFAINKEIAQKYYRELIDFSQSVGAESDNLINSILRLPDVLVNKEDRVSEDEWFFLRDLVVEALGALKSFREQEGTSLAKDLIERINNIDKLLKEVPKYEGARVELVRERMRKALEDLSVAVDENRLEQELIFYIEKLDVSEEKVRLANHLSYFLQTLGEKEAIGKKIGFIAQEIGREINTLGSKAQHAELQKIVVEMKDNLEKIKEQVLNTL